MRLVKARRAGKHIYYVADDHHIVGLFEQGLEHVQERTTPTAQAGGRRSSRRALHGAAIPPGDA